MTRCLNVVLLVLVALLAPSDLAKAEGKSVSVKGYYRKDGTYVRPHTRSAPSSGFRVDAPMPSIPLYATATETADEQRKGFSGESRLSPKARMEPRTNAKTAPRVSARAARPPYELRDWHDLDGALIGHARLKWQAMTLLRLETKDGEPLEVETEELSKIDLEWLEKAHRSPDLVRERLNAATSAE